MDSPYREPKPLSEVIAPDRRRQRAAVLVVTSMIAGAAIFQLAQWALHERDSKAASVPLVESTSTTNASRIERTTLRGPDGLVTIPGSERMIVHVWLAGCQDCMPAFEAMKELEQRGGLDVGAPIVNVSYGDADPAWAAGYGLRKNLVHDRGGHLIVHPLGITSFTTLVVDFDGTILHRELPDRPGYVARLQKIVGRRPPVPNEPMPVSLTPDEVQRVVAKYRAGLNRICWGKRDAPSDVDSAKVTLNLVVGAGGNVVSASASGTDALVASCVETQARSWLFPAHAERSTAIQIPFVFTRD